MLKASIADSGSDCMFCQEPKNELPSWGTLLPLFPPSLLCNNCENQLKAIAGPSCAICSRPQPVNEVCEDCKRWESDPDLQGILDHNRSLYRYNNIMQEMIAQWKYRGDAALALIFRENIRKLYLHHYTGYIPVPIPLSSKRLIERGFNQSQLLADFTNEPLAFYEKWQLLTRKSSPVPAVLPLLERTIHEEKQSKKSRRERLLAKENPFQLSSAFKFSVNSKNFILLDDIYTTGTTLRKAAKRLKEHGAKSVCAITLARG
ncbi:ComF family protein [Alteribacillus sp. YIM 98480]|uniref:ComF family protein n=1 Tax=Alteribacillus sp. YIM 98480 TaxID=2606599 RepID=UPI001E5AAA94|nr:ComF family protein [Alteribacillus sp. YIM 98480]